MADKTRVSQQKPSVVKSFYCPLEFEPTWDAFCLHVRKQSKKNKNLGGVAGVIRMWVIAYMKGVKAHVEAEEEEKEEAETEEIVEETEEAEEIIA